MKYGKDCFFLPFLSYKNQRDAGQQRCCGDTARAAAAACGAPFRRIIAQIQTFEGVLNAAEEIRYRRSVEVIADDHGGSAVP